MITIVKYGFGKYRKRLYTFVKTTDGKNIRCGKSLEQIVGEQCSYGQPIRVKVENKYKSNGVYDIHCEAIF